MRELVESPAARSHFGVTHTRTRSAWLSHVGTANTKQGQPARDVCDDRERKNYFAIKRRSDRLLETLIIARDRYSTAACPERSTPRCSEPFEAPLQ
jgi:hypothetical protein